MNSGQLYQKFREHYDEIFTNCSLVISLPYSISIFGGTACVFGWPVMNQPIPQRMYMGFRKNETSVISVVSYIRMNPRTGQMEQVKSDPFYSPDHNFSNQLKIIFPDSGMDIFILTEFEGKNADLVSGWAILWMDMLSGNIDQTMVQWLKKSEGEALHGNEHVKWLLKNILLLRMSYNSLTIGWSCLDAFVCGLIDTDLPVIHMQGKGLYSLNDETVGKKEILKKLHDSGASYITKRAEELLNVEFNKEIPFDIMMFSLGDYRNIGWYQTFLNWWENSEWLKKLLIKGNSELTDSFFLGESEKNQLLYKSIEVISAYIFHVTQVFLDTLLAKEKTGTLFFYLKRNMELINTLLGKYNLSSHEWEDTDISALEWVMKSLYPQLQKDNYFIYTTGSSTELKYVVLIPRHLPIQSSEHINTELQKHFQKPAALIYSSKSDGFAKEGLRIEQFLSNGLRHGDYTEGKVILTDENGKKMLCLNQEDALKKSQEWVLVDTIHKKIYMQGEKLSSKDLLSQSATADVLALLLGNIWKDIGNLRLPSSGYSKNKSEMTGKVLLPLLNLIEKRFEYRLPIVCKGSIGEYYLKLNQPEIKIFILGKC